MGSGEMELLAARALEQAEITRLPVSMNRLADWLGVRLFTYRQFAEAAGITQQEVAQRFGPDGFTQLISDQLAVFYCYRGHVGRMRWTLAHELAHILLGHMDNGGDETPYTDRQADHLAAALLCPRGVVERCGCGSSGELAQLCDISQAAAQCRYRELWQGGSAPVPATMQDFIAERRQQAVEPGLAEIPPQRCSRRL